MKKLSSFELGWLVGILEGEGYFEYNGCSQKVCVRMTDFDTMETVSDLVGRAVGVAVEVRAITPINPNAQEIYSCEVTGERARILMKLVAPHLHYRRRQRVWQSLNKYKGKKLRLADSGIDVLAFARSRKESA